MYCTKMVIIPLYKVNRFANVMGEKADITVYLNVNRKTDSCRPTGTLPSKDENFLAFVYHAYFCFINHLSYTSCSIT
jgi:hypothetical protein